MSYRSDQDAAFARAEALELENERLRVENEELRAKADAASEFWTSFLDGENNRLEAENKQLHEQVAWLKSQLPPSVEQVMDLALRQQAIAKQLGRELEENQRRFQLGKRIVIVVVFLWMISQYLPLMALLL